MKSLSPDIIKYLSSSCSFIIVANKVICLTILNIHNFVWKVIFNFILNFCYNGKYLIPIKRTVLSCLFSAVLIIGKNSLRQGSPASEHNTRSPNSSLNLTLKPLNRLFISLIISLLGLTSAPYLHLCHKV